MEVSSVEKSKYEPKFGRVLIKREIKEKIGSIILPDSAAKRLASCEGIIIALGETAGFTDSYYKDADGILLHHIVQTLKVGQRILFGRHSGAWLDARFDSKGQDTDEGTLFICQDADILAVINE